MNLTYNIKSFVETLEDYKVGLEEHLYGEFGQREKCLSEGQPKSDCEDVLIMDYKILKPELIEIQGEIGRVRLFIDVLTKFVNESN